MDQRKGTSDQSKGRRIQFVDGVKHVLVKACVANGDDWECERPAHLKSQCRTHYSQKQRGEPWSRIARPIVATPLTVAQMAAIRNLAGKGYTATEIAKDIGRKRSTVNYFAKTNGVTVVSYRGKEAHDIVAKRVTVAESVAKRGGSYLDLSKAFGLSYRTTMQFVRKNAPHLMSQLSRTGREARRTQMRLSQLRALASKGYTKSEAVTAISADNTERRAVLAMLKRKQVNIPFATPGKPRSVGMWLASSWGTSRLGDELNDEFETDSECADLDGGKFDNADLCQSDLA